MIRIGINKNKKLVVDFQYSKELVDIMHELPSRAFNKKTKYWEIPLIDLPILRDVLEPYVKKNGIKPTLTDSAREEYLKLIKSYNNLKEIAELSDLDYKTVGLKKDVQLYPFQKVGVKFLEEAKRGLLALDMGLGKANSINSKLLTPNGWVRMGDIKIEDEVFGSDGIPHKVIGVFPQGVQKCYQVKFTDDSMSECTGEHLWNIQSPCQKLRKTGYKTVQLKDFKNDLHDKNGNTKWFIPMVKPIQFNKQTLPIDPYILGALIGDGSLHSGSIELSSIDKFMVNEFNRILSKKCKVETVGYGSNRIYNIDKNKYNIKKEIDLLKLNVLSYNKFIPDIYKFSSIKQRIALLQGLMDTDGGVDTRKDGIVISYTTTSEKLCDDIQFLIESLGGKARKSSRIPTYTYLGKKKKGRIAYRLNISLPNNIIPFRLPRKFKAYTPRTKYQPYRGVESVRYIGKKECQCILIDSHDHLYVTDHCILTHNTIISLSATSSLLKQKKIKKPLIICPASLKFNWAIEIAKFSKYSYTLVGGTAKQRKEQYQNDSDFTIMNYDLLRFDIDIIKKIGWDLIIADEIQRAKNYTTAISKNIQKLKPEYVFGLTGTPIENSIMDLFTIMKFIDLNMFGSNGKYFKDRYCHVDGWGRILEYRNDRHHEIDRKTSYFMMRRKKRDVLKDLPEKTVSFHYVMLDEEERRVYNDYKRRVTDDLRSESGRSIDVLSQIVFLREICDSINLVEPQENIVSSKLEELKTILPELPEDSKVVIFTEYERMAQIIENNIPYLSVHLHGGIKSECRLEKEVEKKIKKENKNIIGKELDIMIHEEKQKSTCLNCAYYNNKEECNSRKKIVSKFNHDPDVKVFISTNAGKEGLNLQIANVVINYDLSFNPAVNEQRIARIDRIGQKSENILVINMVCLDTIEQKILKTLEEKQGLFNKVIDKTDKDILKRMGVQDLIELL